MFQAFFNKLLERADGFAILDNDLSLESLICIHERSLDLLVSLVQNPLNFL